MRLCKLAASLLLVALAPLALAQHSNWSYQGKTGPLNWGKLDPDYQACSKGHQQSPVDIRGAHLNKNLPAIEFHYMAGSITEENNGHTIVMNVTPGSYIVIEGVRYNLVQFHFHHPSENTVRGKYSDMEVHFVHKSADGKIVVLAVFMAEDAFKPNTVLAALWPKLPKSVGTTSKVTEMVNPAGLLPPTPGYWTFEGSLTTPPCSEGVRWFVFVDPLTLSRDQLKAFSALYDMNARPVQDLHGRKIEASQ